ncbi:hypothetical protein AcV7_004487, partial [Taiwanofungus camphoratus]
LSWRISIFVGHHLARVERKTMQNPSSPLCASDHHHLCCKLLCPCWSWAQKSSSLTSRRLL